MSLNDTPSANRMHIGFFGCRNAGKSSLVNAVTGQDLAIVSGIKGTTTDPVYKAMEILPLGPVLIIDTPGIDDEGTLGDERVRRAKQVLNKTDVAVLIVDASAAPNGELCPAEKELIELFKAKNVPYIIVQNKIDTIESSTSYPLHTTSFSLCVSAKTGHNIELLKEEIAALGRAQENANEKTLIADLIKPLDIVLLVVPIDSAAPRGRLILPQQQIIRGVLDSGAIAVVVKETELREALARLGQKPALVITDSQAFHIAAAEVPDYVPLTSFSILFARYKGLLATAVRSVQSLHSLQDGDKVLIAEGCTHHRQCDDIGTVKLPRMIKNFTGKDPEFCFCSGGTFPEDLSPYKMIIHCGACMLNEREMQYRRQCAEDQGIPFSNYGITIAFMQGILERSVAMLGLS